MPGAVDLHVHLREPSTNPAETIEGGTRAALLGGFVMVADMPNNPGMPVWTRQRLDTKIAIATEKSWMPIGFYAGSQPEADNVGELEAMAEMAIGLKLYGDPTTGNENTYEASDFRQIVAEWHRVAPNKPIMFHAGPDNLKGMIDLVVGEFRHHLHVCHVNDSEQVEWVNLANRANDLPVTCGICPHHLLKTSHDVHTQGSFAEMMPPLAHQDEAERLRELLNRGYIDVIESDFAPHSIDAKLQAENTGGHCKGVPGIEHVLPLLMYQVKKGRLSEQRYIDATSRMPAEILGVKMDDTTTTTWDFSDGAYRIGDLDVESSCEWTPYTGMLGYGRLKTVKIAGKTVLSNFHTLSEKHPAIVSERDTVIA